MEEAFLHYVWQNQAFDKAQLQTTDGKPVEVLETGLPNDNAGPDFFNARLRMENMEWVGNVEVHINSKDWFEHKHQHDTAYDNVILHLVWNNDQPVFHRDGSPIPALELKDKIDKTLINNYQALLQSRNIIPCQAYVDSIPKIKWLSMFDRALSTRLKRKAETLKGMLQENQYDWENTAWQLLANNFGFKINNEPFLRLAKKLPVKILQKHSNNLLQTEALLFGQAGLLNGTFKDAYPGCLQREFHFLSHKYGLEQTLLADHEWKRLRLRPANFPTIRLAQLARFIHVNKKFFAAFIEAPRPGILFDMFHIKQSEYWQKHYFFDKPAKKTVPGLGKPAKEILIINTVVPLLAAYAIEKGQQEYMDKAIAILEQLPAENNHIIKKWKALGFTFKNAFDAQAAIELYNNFCSIKKCLVCDAGRTLVKQNPK